LRRQRVDAIEPPAATPIRQGAHWPDVLQIAQMLDHRWRVSAGGFGQFGESAWALREATGHLQAQAIRQGIEKQIRIQLRRNIIGGHGAILR
jgi:hypothetical protein